MKPCLRVERLSKRYRIGAAALLGARNLTETLKHSLRSAWEGVTGRGGAAGGERSFWALNDLSFEMQPGEVLGIIGRNGAGKSTLLKILSRVVEPTSGRAVFRGRVGSLLEVGTGFHPELTGRENIYLNGSILGMSRREIKRHFDAIVAFSEIERFLETPVKRYSSGMYVRLAFSVAAHLEPDILVVDEVLAVGDAAFQEKCLGQMRRTASQGRTVLFVSHNLVAVRQLCTTGLWIDAGRLQQSGPVTDVVAAYAREHARLAQGTFAPETMRGDGRVELLDYRVTDGSGRTDRLPTTNEDVVITARARVRAPVRHPACGVNVFNEFGVLMTCINTVEQGVALEPLPGGEVELAVRLHKVPYTPGRYTASLWVMSPQGHMYVMAENAIAFEIGQGLLYGTNEVDYRYGCVYTKVGFSLTPGPPANGHPAG
jgi:lipopolysaccharide transport system ATP-binding protein